MKLQTKYCLAILALVGSLFLVFAAAVFVRSRSMMSSVISTTSQEMEKSLLEQLRKRAELSVGVLAENLTNPVYQYDMERIYGLTKTLKEREHVLYVYVYEKSGRIIHDGTKELFLYNQILKDEASKKAVSAKQLTVQTTQDRLDVAAPILFHDQLLGGVKVGFSLKGMQGDSGLILMKDALGKLERSITQSNLSVFGIMAIGISVLAMILALYLGRKLSQPILTIAEAAKEIGAGKLDTRLRLKRVDELGALAESINEMAINLERTINELTRRNQELAVLHRISAALSESLELDRVLHEAINRITEVFQFDATRIFLLNSETNELRLSASFEAQPELFADVKSYRIGQGMTGKVAETGEDIIVEDIQNSPEHDELSDNQRLREQGYGFFAAFPIKGKLRTLGTLVCVGENPRWLSAEEVRLIKSMAEQIGVAAENAILFQEANQKTMELRNIIEEAEKAKQELEFEIVGHREARAALLNYQAKLRALASELSLVEGRERHRMASYLHDHIGQILALAMIKLGMLQQLLAGTDSADSAAEVRGLIEQAITEARSLTLELSPPLLRLRGLEAALEWLADSMSKRYEISIDVLHDGQAKPLGQDIALVLYESVRELITNVFKHAKTHSAKLSITRIEDAIQVKVEDCGVGFNVFETLALHGKPSGFGLFNIFERLAELGGRFEVKSVPGLGTQATLWAPLRRSEINEEEKAA